MFVAFFLRRKVILNSPRVKIGFCLENHSLFFVLELSLLEYVFLSLLSLSRYSKGLRLKSCPFPVMAAKGQRDKGTHIYQGQVRMFARVFAASSAKEDHSGGDKASCARNYI